MQVIGYSQKLLNGRTKKRETKDCVVMSWSNCFDAPYEKSWEYLKQFGRPWRRGMSLKDIKDALIACKKTKVKFGPYNSKNRVTLKKFTEKHPIGRYFVVVRGHALCVKDGVVYDHSERPGRQVVFAARVYLEGEI